MFQAKPLGASAGSGIHPLASRFAIGICAPDNFFRAAPTVSMWAKAAALVLGLLLAPAAAQAAEWVPISSDAESAFYFDRASLKRQGDVVEVLLLWDFPEVQMTRRPIKPYLSATRLTRYDCKAGQRANVESTLYRGPMASGDITEIYRTPDEQLRFEWVNAQAPGGESMRRVCDAAAEAR